MELLESIILLAAPEILITIGFNINTYNKTMSKYHQKTEETIGVYTYQEMRVETKAIVKELRKEYANYPKILKYGVNRAINKMRKEDSKLFN